jgi:hypothetical protein
MTRRDAGSTHGGTSWSKRFSVVLGDIDLLILVLLGAMLLPLIIGPFIVVYEFMKAEAYTAAGLVGAVFAGCAALAIRAVRRGELGPGTLAAALALLAFIAFMATRLPR